MLDAVYRATSATSVGYSCRSALGIARVLKRNKKEYPKLSDHIAVPSRWSSYRHRTTSSSSGKTSVAIVDKQGSPSRIASIGSIGTITASSSSAMCPSVKRADDAVLEVPTYSLSRSARSSTSVVRPSCVTSSPLPAVLYRYQWRAGSCEPSSSSLAEHEGHCL